MFVKESMNDEIFIDSFLLKNKRYFLLTILSRLTIIVSALSNKE